MNVRCLVNVFAVLIAFPFSTNSLPPSEENGSDQGITSEKIYDTQTWIDANKVLMFVTNKGSFAYDQGGILGKNDGFYYPYLGLDNILNGIATNATCFAAGIWIAGVNASTGDTLVSVAEYSDDYYPGPMSGGTYISGAHTDPVYRVYKLYNDSLSANPNQDYLEWPAADGAPLDTLDNPMLFGDQTLWSVFNDANNLFHTNDASTPTGLDVEIQHSVWASDEPGEDTVLYNVWIPVQQRGTTQLKVTVEVIDPPALTGDNYMVIVHTDSILGTVWHLINATTSDTVLSNQTTFDNDNTTVTDGFLVQLSNPIGRFLSFEVVANANGPLIPPAGGALGFQGFPSLNPDDGQQVGAGRWAIHTGDTQPVGSRGSFEAFLSRVFRSSNSFGANLGRNDLEWRFTGSNNNPGVGGGYAWEPFDQGLAIWVPFELWGIGIETPDDLSDDVRLIPWMIDNSRSGTFNLESWGDAATAPQGYVVGDPATEHSASGGFNDPFTDWVYWFMPVDSSPGEAGYQEFEDSILNNPTSYSGPGTELLARTVLINWNGGEQPPFNQDLPEQGTIFRITAPSEFLVDTFDFQPTPPPTFLIGPEAVSIYSKYKLINKSSNTYNDFFISLWFDPDLGNAGDDLIGCDTIDNIFYCYNDGADSDYGSAPPAFGGKLISGPPMYSFMRYINGTDPQSLTWTYQYMNGLDASRGGIPLPNGTRYAVPGDPVTGLGDIDTNSTDVRMMATFGPLTFAPGDTQEIVFKLAVGHSNDYLSSITRLKEILNFNPPSFEDTCCIGIRGDIDGDGDDNGVLDLTYLIDYIFRGGPAPLCPREADLNNDGLSATILDLTSIIDDIFRGAPSPGNCN